MGEPEELDEDLFADLYEGDEVPSKPLQPPTTVKHEEISSDAINSEVPEPVLEMSTEPSHNHSNGTNGAVVKGDDGDVKMKGNGWDSAPNQHYDGGPVENDDNYGPIGIKEDG
ncbi:hypothetical protein K432DRAFT_306425 [Lepidopterella palustris CBS 459.81]|uniref:Uncharacterized protein n=1 Tax=Lepidopterella palustris CBS 459.81 TaxID=1314670 RepID=A0A8E2E3A2_9PEZI|nr:hypothetical protein K432DRAFT_306425 [Lepidopterella palustris CBS 459.81]